MKEERRMRVKKLNIHKIHLQKLAKFEEGRERHHAEGRRNEGKEGKETEEKQSIL